MGETEIKEVITNLIENAEFGKKVTVDFSGLAIPIEISITFTGGWKVLYTLVPGMSFELIKGEGAYLEELKITFMPHEGLK
jgi:hypothetical protein